MGQEKLLKLFDFRELDVPEKLFELNYNEADVDRKLEEVREKFLVIQAVPGPVEPGDIVTLDVPAAGEREAETLQINVRKYFYDNEFEDALVGRMPGGSLTLPARGAGRPCTLTQIKRRVLPPLTDELVGKLGLEGVETVADCRKLFTDRFVAQARRKKTEAILTMVINQVVQRSQFGDLTEDVDAALAETEASSRFLAQQYGMTYEEYLAQTIPAKYETADQKARYLRGQAEAEVKQNLIYTHYVSEKGLVIDRAGYEAIKQSYLDRGVDPQQIERMFSYKVYQREAAGQFFQKTVLDCYKNKFEVVAK